MSSISILPELTEIMSASKKLILSEKSEVVLYLLSFPLGLKLSRLLKCSHVGTAETFKPSNWKWPLDNSSGHYGRWHIFKLFKE